MQPGRRAKSDHTRVGGQTTRVWGPWEAGWVLAHVRWGLLECWALSGGRETKEGAVPLLERDELPTEVVGWGPIWVYFGGSTRGLIMNHVVRRREKQDVRPTAKFLDWSAGDTRAPFTEMGRTGRSRSGMGVGCVIV